MPLCEVVLDSEDHQEVRITDEPLVIGDVFDLNGTHWEVVRALAPSDRAHARVQCRRATEMRRTADEMRIRAEATRRRLKGLRSRGNDESP